MASRTRRADARLSARSAGRHRRWLAGCLLGCALTAALPTSAPGRFTTGLSGPEYTSADGSERGHWFDETAGAHAGIVRINVIWRSVVSGTPADPSNPADPAYDFGALDAAVRDAAARNIDLLLTLYEAPDFAEGAARESSAPPGT